MSMKKITVQKTAAALIAAAMTIIAGVQFYAHRHYLMPIVAGEGVTRVGMLSDYLPSLKGTAADTHVFYLDGPEPGGTALVIANTHSNEPAALLSALVLVENCRVRKGSLIIIPQFNNSGSRNTKPGDGYPLFFTIPTNWGNMKFRMGNRNAAPLDQWPDPDVYVHYPDRKLFSYLDVRNTNRTWPGRAKGPLMERVTFATMELIRKLNVDVAIDLHGAETMFPVTNCIVAPEKSMWIATMASLTAQAKDGFENHVEPSPQNFRGLSHREIGDFSEAKPFLLEAPIPFLDQPTGPKTVDFLLNGKDPFLLSLARQKKLFVPYDKEGWPIRKRVGQHCSMIEEILNQQSAVAPDKAIIIEGVPDYRELVDKGLGYFYHDPGKMAPDRIYYN